MKQLIKSYHVNEFKYNPITSLSTHWILPNVLRVELDILVSIHDLAPVSCSHLLNLENNLDEVYNRVIGTYSIYMASCMLYCHATVYWKIYQFVAFWGNIPSRTNQGNVGFSTKLMPRKTVYHLFFHSMNFSLIVRLISEVVARKHVWYRTLRQCMHVLHLTDQMVTRSIGAARIRLEGGGVVIQPQELYPPHNDIVYPVIEHWDNWSSGEWYVHINTLTYLKCYIQLDI